MGEGARVEDFGSINDFRIALIKFAETANAALGDAETDVTRTMMWLDGEQQAYWIQQIRSRKEALAKAQDALRQKKIFKDSSGSTPSAVEEQKAVTVCQRRVVEAEEKLVKVRRYLKELQKEMLLYKGQVQRFATAVSSDVPKAIAYLGALFDRLSEYASIGPAGGPAGMDESMARFFGVAPGTSMTRGEGAPLQPADYAKLRTQLPSDDQRQAAQVAPQAAFALPTLPPTQKNVVETLVTVEHTPDPAERVTIATSALAATQIFLIRIVGAQGGSAWHVGPTDPQADRGAMTATTVEGLQALRADWIPLLSLKPGSLAVLNASGVVALLDGADKNVWPASPPTDASAPPTA